MKTLGVLSLTLSLLAAPALAEGLEPGQQAGKLSIGEVTLSGLLGTDGTKAAVIYVTSYTCPYALAADEKLGEVVKSYADKGVLFVGIYPNRTENAEQMKAHGEKKGFTHRLLVDPGAAASKALGSEVTPTFFLFDKSGVLRYRGNLRELAAAADAVLAGDQVATSRTFASGCTIKWPSEGPREPAPAAPRGPGRGERRRPVEMTAAAKAWVDTLVEALSSSDLDVRRSAEAGLAAMGPRTMPYLRQKREGAEGEAAKALDRAMERLGRQNRGRSLVDSQRRTVLQTLTDLTDEQKAALDELYGKLKKREQELMKKREQGAGREEVREGYRTLMTDAQAALAEILTPEQMEKLRELRDRRRFRGGRTDAPRRR
jgi:hypothetical protein